MSMSFQLHEGELPNVRHPFLRLRMPTTLEGESKTHQSHAKTVDINNIIARYKDTGYLPPSTRPPQFMDATPFSEDLTTLHVKAIETIKNTDEFMASYNFNASTEEQTKGEAPEGAEGE